MTHDSLLTPAAPVPPDVARLAADAGLGSFRKTYVPKRVNWVALVFMAVVGLAMVIVLIGLWILWEVSRAPNINRARAARRVYLFEHGFVVVDRPDDPQVYRFDQIDTVFQKIVSRRSYGIEVGRNYLYTITARDGRTVKLTQFYAEIAELGPLINQLVSAALLPGTLEAIRRGHSVQFGDMTVNANGIAGRRKSVIWKEVSQVRVSNGYVSVGVSGKFLSLSSTRAANLPNLPLFLTLAEGLHREAQGR